MMQTPPAVRIVEVGPRDGLQNIRQSINSTTKLELIRRLRDTGLQTIELTSFVSPRAIPQLADAQTVVQSPDIQALLKNPALRLPVLVPNLKGLDRALQNNVKEVAVFISATEGFSRANINCTVDEGLERARQVASKAASAGLSVRGYAQSSLLYYYMLTVAATSRVFSQTPTMDRPIPRLCYAAQRPCSMQAATKSVSATLWESALLQRCGN